MINYYHFFFALFTMKTFFNYIIKLIEFTKCSQVNDLGAKFFLLIWKHWLSYLKLIASLEHFFYIYLEKFDLAMRDAYLVPITYWLYFYFSNIVWPFNVNLVSYDFAWTGCAADWRSTSLKFYKNVEEKEPASAMWRREPASAPTTTSSQL
jgi:hypothetical protein